MFVIIIAPVLAWRKQSLGRKEKRKSEGGQCGRPTKKKTKNNTNETTQTNKQSYEQLSSLITHSEISHALVLILILAIARTAFKYNK